MNEILQMRNIHKSFGATKALKGVDLDIIRGQVNAIVGSNGAGKSTLMKTLAGIYRPDEGTILLDGQDITGLTPLKLQELGIQVVHQVLNIVGSMTVLENILLANPPVRRGLLSWKAGEERVRTILKQIDFPLDLNAPAGSLSVSQQQFVILARALVHQPKVLVLDEPTARLGMEETQKLFSLIRTLKQQGATIIYISHRMEEIYTICDRISVFRDGTHVLSQSVDQLSEAQLVQAMLGKQMDTFFPKAQAQVGQEVLQIQDLRYRNRLNGVSLNVRAGEIVSLVGAVGAGKTEILECLFGLRHADGGKMVLRGAELPRSYSARHAIHLGMALIPEDRASQGMIGDDTVRANISSVDMPKVCKGGVFIRAKEDRLAKSLVDRLDVRPNDIHYIMTGLSGGNQQKVVVGKWLTSDYPLYLMDEVTAGVDIEAKAEIYKIIGQIAEKGGAVLLATGDIEEAMGISDRIIVLYKGRIVYESSPAQTTKDDLLARIMGGGSRAQ
ncbi:MAG: sugar ABC transporter ATP-binding protein [Candidatus Limiplasma sp.]|nr:sugar ABC transporter ATP-binding protein [Candidatus Limiplasma sp.]